MIFQDILPILSLVLNAIFGGGLLITIVTLRSKKREAAALAAKADADADKQEINNDRLISENLMQFIVNPLKNRIDGLEEEIQKLRSDIIKLQHAIDSANDCPYYEACPVLNSLQHSSSQKGSICQSIKSK